MTTITLVDFGCMACGREQHVIVAELRQLSLLPGRCVHCGGSMVVVSSTTKHVYDESKIDFFDTPRRGPPPESAHSDEARP